MKARGGRAAGGEARERERLTRAMEKVGGGEEAWGMLAVGEERRGRDEVEERCGGLAGAYREIEGV